MKTKSLFPKKTKTVQKTKAGKNVEIQKYNPLTGKGVTKEKDVEYKSSNSPRKVYKSKEVVKRDKDKNWKSLTEKKVLKENNRTIKKAKDYKTFKKGGSIKNK